ncbi:MAG: hypothetical protein Q8L71_00490 [Thiobacillus sp.]|nr:hypothetical protein [Thiobacillus sp.]
MRYPVMIVESDDWGAGPVETQASALNRLVDVLSHYQDQNGRHPVMTLALVLAVPDGPAIRRDGQYHRRLLDDLLFEPVRQAIERGRAAGVFALQLHGLEHYWPAALLRAAETDERVRAWLASPSRTENLPSPLQSRWIDASTLPSRPLPEAEIQRATAEEVAVYERVLGQSPRVVVPPTFVWDERVEMAWAARGVEFVVTPGLRNTCRDADGQPSCAAGPIRNGERGKCVTYIVRNDYFEPEKGHTFVDGLAALRSRSEQGRPCLLETHRSNFIGLEAECSNAELHRLIAQALRKYPDLRFMSTLELGRAMRDHSPLLLEVRASRRLTAWVNRLTELPRFWKLGRLIGIAAVLCLIATKIKRDRRSQDQ